MVVRSMYFIKCDFSRRKLCQEEVACLTKYARVRLFMRNNHDCNRKMIEEIIGTDAEPVGICKTETPAPAELSKGEIIELLFRQIDELDSEIKRLEEEYRKVTTAIEVLGRI